jgi:hypothetical protein
MLFLAGLANSIRGFCETEPFYSDAMAGAGVVDCTSRQADKVFVISERHGR